MQSTYFIFTVICIESRNSHVYVYIQCTKEYICKGESLNATELHIVQLFFSVHVAVIKELSMKDISHVHNAIHAKFKHAKMIGTRTCK